MNIASNEDWKRSLCHCISITLVLKLSTGTGTLKVHSAWWGRRGWGRGGRGGTTGSSCLRFCNFVIWSIFCSPASPLTPIFMLSIICCVQVLWGLYSLRIVGDPAIVSYNLPTATSFSVLQVHPRLIFRGKPLSKVTYMLTTTYSFLLLLANRMRTSVLEITNKLKKMTCSYHIQQ